MTAISVNRSLKILMLAPTMFFADYGGHIRILEEAKELRRMGHRVTILTYPNGRDIAGLDVRRCLGVPFNYRVEVGSSRHKYYLDFMLMLRALLYIVKNKPDVIHAHMHEGTLIGWFLRKLTGAPLVFDFQGSLTGEMVDHNFLAQDSKRYRFFRWLESRIDKMPQVILTSSHQAAKHLKHEFHVPEGRIHPTPDCVDAHTFDPAAFSGAAKMKLKQALDIPTHKKLIVYAGILTKYQGIDHLLTALNQLSQQREDFHLLLMGFPSVAEYKEMAHNLGLTSMVTFTGRLPYDQLPQHLAIGDLAVAPKLSATEGCGKILNYMSMALPTITFRTPVSCDYLGHYGLYAEATTAAALAAAINRGLNLSQAERQQNGHVLRQIAIARYSWQKTGRQLETVYGAILAGHPQPARAVKQASIRA